MKTGNLKCDCGKILYFSTIRDNLSCIYCGKTHNISHYPEVNETDEHGDEIKSKEGEQ